MPQPVNLPQEFIQLISKSIPKNLSIDDFYDYCQRPLRRSIRVNTLKISTEQFCQRMTTQGWQLTPVPWCLEGFWLEREDDSISLGNTLEHLGGLFYIQEASSMMPVTALFKQILPDNALILDAAAAPGSKTTQIAANLNHHGAIVANEYSASRVKTLYANLQRCGISNVAITNYNADVFGPWLPERFDGILLDAPCSGEGTLRKDASAMSNWSLDHVEQVSQLQLDLIDSALHALKPGGVLVYSTCTLNTIENQGVLDQLRQRYPDTFEVIPLGELFEGAQEAITEQGYLHVWPQLFDCEGFFVAALRKTQSLPAPKSVHKRLKPIAFKSANRKVIAQLNEYLTSQFGFALDDSHGRIVIRENEYWLFPEGLLNLTKGMRFNRIGIKIAEQFKTNFRLTHEAAIRFDQLTQSKQVEISAQQAQEYYRGRDIPLPAEGRKGEVILNCQGVTLGLGKWVNNKIKNSLPRELVKDETQF